MTWVTKCDDCFYRNTCDLPNLWDKDGCGLFDPSNKKKKCDSCSVKNYCKLPFSYGDECSVYDLIKE